VLSLVKPALCQFKQKVHSCILDATNVVAHIVFVILHHATSMPCNMTWPLSGRDDGTYQQYVHGKS